MLSMFHGPYVRPSCVWVNKAPLYGFSKLDDDGSKPTVIVVGLRTMKPVIVRPLTMRYQYAPPVRSKERSVSRMSEDTVCCHGHSTSTPRRVSV